MKRDTKMAFNMPEMECIVTEEQEMYKGGTGGSGYYGSGLWLATGSGVWDTDGYSSVFF